MINTIENEYLKVEINSFGSELFSLYDKVKNKELLWQGDKNIWPRRSPTLFPVCGPTHDPKMPQHGFVRDYEHELTSNSETMLVYTFSSTDKTKEIYPYDFSFLTIYELKGKNLEYSFKVINKTDGELPFSLGFHSGFLANENSVLKFEKNENCNRIQGNDDNLIYTKIENFMNGRNSFSLSDELFPTVIILESPKSDYITVINDDEPVLNIHFKDFPYVAIWVIETPAPFVCIEPWHGIPDPVTPYEKLTDKPAIQILPKGEEFIATQVIELL